MEEIKYVLLEHIQTNIFDQLNDLLQVQRYIKFFSLFEMYSHPQLYFLFSSFSKFQRVRTFYVSPDLKNIQLIENISLNILQ